MCYVFSFSYSLVKFKKQNLCFNISDIHTQKQTEFSTFNSEV